MRLKIFILTVLLVSVLAASVIAEADSISVSSAEAESAEVLEYDEIIAEDVEDVLVEISREYRRGVGVSFTRGVGSANDREKGFFVYASWAVAVALNNDESSDSVRKFRSGGVLSIPRFNSRYKLVKTSDVDLDDSTTFYLVPLRVGLSDADDASSNSVGKLTLSRKEKYDGLARWSGTLDIDSGDNAGSYTVHVDTTTKRVKRISPEVRKNVVKTRRLAEKVRSGELDVEATLEDGEVEATFTDEEGNSKTVRADVSKRKRWWQFWR